MYLRADFFLLSKQGHDNSLLGGKISKKCFRGLVYLSGDLWLQGTHAPCRLGILAREHTQRILLSGEAKVSEINANWFGKKCLGSSEEVEKNRNCFSISYRLWLG